MRVADIDTINVEDSYDGPRPCWPLTHEACLEIAQVRQGWPNPDSHSWQAHLEPGFPTFNEDGRLAQHLLS
eukprot:702161-Pleurochrysis_carterae.AAC.2